MNLDWHTSADGAPTPNTEFARAHAPGRVDGGGAQMLHRRHAKRR